MSDNNSNHGFNKIGGHILGNMMEGLIGSGAGKDRTGNVLLLLFVIIGLGIIILFLYASLEVIHLFTRTKFGADAISKFNVVVAFITFWGLSYFCYDCYKNYDGEIMAFGSEYSYWYATITFLFVGVIVFYRGLLTGVKDDSEVIHTVFRGNSWLLSGLVKEGVPQSIVQDIAEPFLFLALGFCLFSYNYIWGLPFIFCAFSYWLHLGYETLKGVLSIRTQLSNEGLVYTQNRRATKIIS